MYYNSLMGVVVLVVEEETRYFFFPAEDQCSTVVLGLIYEVPSPTSVLFTPLPKEMPKD